MKLLFLLKERFYGSSEKSYGLINSVVNIEEFLSKFEFECSVKTVVDSNDIDREVFNFKPDVVVIEALWVSSEKIKELMDIPRYRHINWIIRIHSDIGFLAAETNALKYVNGYQSVKNSSSHYNNKLHVAFNHEQLANSMCSIGKYMYLPNIVEVKQSIPNRKVYKDHIDIGCFGATRLLKNQLFQALCSIMFANKADKKLLFHITSEYSDKQDSVLTNITELFKGSIHELVVHKWMNNEDLQSLIRKMDFGMQLSFTESFNIVAAEFVNNSKLILVSDPITWMPEELKTSTTDYLKVVEDMDKIYKNRDSKELKNKQRSHLHEHNTIAKEMWILILSMMK
jgi:hypothetical protein